MSKYTPPSRDSLDELLSVARRRVVMPCRDWQRTLASPRFAQDVIDQKIIDGPHRRSKAGDVGQAQRLHPRDYRDLLRIIRLKAQGIKHRDGWLFYLWLYGRDYPFERVRAACTGLYQAQVKTALKDIAPTGRWTEPIGTKYARRVKHNPSQTPNLDAADLFEPIMAAMLLPSQIDSIHPDTAKIAETIIFSSNAANIANMLSKADVEKTLNILLNHVRADKLLDESEQQNVLGLVGPLAGAFKLGDASPMYDFGLHYAHKLHGFMTDYRGNSRMLAALKEASQEDYEKARRTLHQLRPGKVRRFMNEVLKVSPEHERKTLDAALALSKLIWDNIRNNPASAIIIFAAALEDNVSNLHFAASNTDPRKDVLERLKALFDNLK